jgi:hypothetical protein
MGFIVSIPNTGETHMKQYENVSTLQIFGSAILGAVIGGLLALVYVYSTGGF